MAAKKIIYGTDVGEAIKKGIGKLAEAVKVTLGPKGRNVIIEKSFGSPTITKDGVTVANEIEFEDPHEDIGAKMVKEVASKTADIAGDGTTTATVWSGKSGTRPTSSRSASPASSATGFTRCWRWRR